MIKRIEKTPLSYPIRFMFTGDSAAGINPVGDAIFSQMLSQVESLEAKPLFFVNIGDFAGPGVPPRHEHYIKMVDDRLTVPNICVIGNHDMDIPMGLDTFRSIHGPENFEFSYGHTRFVAINDSVESGGPSERELEFIENALKGDDHKMRVIMMHIPPNFDDHFKPHPEWGFKKNEKEFLELVKKYRVNLVCCAHVVAYDVHVHGGVPYLTSGCGGWGLCSHFGACYNINGGIPPHRGSFYHLVEVSLEESGAISWRLLRAFEGNQFDSAWDGRIG